MARLVRTKDLVKGTGPAVEKGDWVVIDFETYLPRGGQVHGERRAEFVVGARRVIAGLEAGLQGMKVGGTREIRVPPHLAYRDKGTGTIPPNAALRLVVTLHQIGKQTTPRQ
jgi:FKBP-type peptidyl-prolyl cis-trans isomerase